MADTIVIPETETETVLDVPWCVIMHNDPINLMPYVTRALMKIFGFPKEKAEALTLEAHQRGRTVVWTGAREPAESYVQQLHGYLLLATLEQTSS